MSTTITQLNHTRDQLKEAFEKVQNKEHWKNPIDAYIRKDEYDITNDAIAFFTGTRINSCVVEDGGPNRGKLHIKAHGYYLGPCN
jgi:hypothetical protein